MTINQAKEILKSHNRWRRGDESVSMADPKDLGIAIDTVVEYLDNIQNKTGVPKMKNPPQPKCSYDRRCYCYLLNWENFYRENPYKEIIE
jgi:hypothetical protein